jgi:hypothetical protein
VNSFNLDASTLASVSAGLPLPMVVIPDPFLSFSVESLLSLLSDALGQSVANEQLLQFFPSRAPNHFLSIFHFGTIDSMNNCSVGVASHNTPQWSGQKKNSVKILTE